MHVFDDCAPAVGHDGGNSIEVYWVGGSEERVEPLSLEHLKAMTSADSWHTRPSPGLHRRPHRPGPGTEISEGCRSARQSACNSDAISRLLNLDRINSDFPNVGRVGSSYDRRSPVFSQNNYHDCMHIALTCSYILLAYLD